MLVDRETTTKHHMMKCRGGMVCSLCLKGPHKGQGVANWVSNHPCSGVAHQRQRQMFLEAG
eukprot:8440175-Prorocentrum_lima.AAC.1